MPRPTSPTPPPPWIFHHPAHLPSPRSGATENACRRQIMGDEQIRHPSRREQPASTKSANPAWVDTSRPGGRLIQHQQIRLARQSARATATRCAWPPDRRAGQAVGSMTIGEPHLRHQCASPGPASRARRCRPVSAVPRSDRQHGHGRVQRGSAGSWKHHLHPPPRHAVLAKAARLVNRPTWLPQSDTLALVRHASAARRGPARSCPTRWRPPRPGIRPAGSIASRPAPRPGPRWSPGRRRGCHGSAARRLRSGPVTATISVSVG